MALVFSNALSTDDHDSGSWTYMPEEGLKLPTKDKAQLPLGGYTLELGCTISTNQFNSYGWY